MITSRRHFIEHERTSLACSSILPRTTSRSCANCIPSNHTDDTHGPMRHVPLDRQLHCKAEAAAKFRPHPSRFSHQGPHMRQGLSSEPLHAPTPRYRLHNRHSSGTGRQHYSVPSLQRCLTTRYSPLKQPIAACGVQ